MAQPEYIHPDIRIQLHREFKTQAAASRMKTPVTVYPLVLGSGHHLFGADDSALRLIDCTSTATGVLMTTYHPVALVP